MEKEGQASIESIVAIAVIMILFIFTLTFTFLRNNNLITAQVILDQNSECSKIANAITQTRLLGDGSESRIFTVSNISTYHPAMLIQVHSKKETGYCNIEQASIGNYTNLTGNLIIRNNNGNITIS